MAAKATEESKGLLFLRPSGYGLVTRDNKIGYSYITGHCRPSSHGFYCLRHTFRAVADELADKTAIRLVMRHTDSSVEAAYINHISDKRIRAACEHVRQWLFGPKK